MIIRALVKRYETRCVSYHVQSVLPTAELQIVCRTFSTYQPSFGCLWTKSVEIDAPAASVDLVQNKFKKEKNENEIGLCTPALKFCRMF